MDMAAADFTNDGTRLSSTGTAPLLALHQRRRRPRSEKRSCELDFEMEHGWATRCATSFARDNTTAASGSWSMRARDWGQPLDRRRPSSWQLPQAESHSPRIPPGTPWAW
jgi:hypothetical protein